MKKNTRFAFNAYLQQLARLNGVAVEELSSKFTVEPSVQQTLEDQIQQSAAFLTLINVTPVTEQSGQLLGLGVGSTIAGTTDTTAKEREPVDPTLMVDVEYKCEQTNFDTVLTYAKLDLWAKFQDFQVRIRDAIVKRQALDRIMIGFNGVKRAKTSNRSENPLLQDVNKGWLQKIREDAPDHVMGSTTTGGETTPGAVKVGKGGEYANLIRNTPFWPDVDLSEFRSVMRTDGTVTQPRLKQVALSAISEVNAELYEFRRCQQMLGYASLAEVPAEQLDGKSERIQHYFNAVYCWARAMLNERYQDYDATASGVKRGEELAEASGDLWRDARWAISRVQDAPHCTVELI